VNYVESHRNNGPYLRLKGYGSQFNKSFCGDIKDLTQSRFDVYVEKNGTVDWSKKITVTDSLNCTFNWDFSKAKKVNWMNINKT